MMIEKIKKISDRIKDETVVFLSELIAIPSYEDEKAVINRCRQEMEKLWR